jgi:hypothetical protein
MKVLVEESNIPNDLFYPMYTGVVLAETQERYLVRHHFILRSWVPKNSPCMKCRIITKI